MRRAARLTWLYPLSLTAALLLSACPSDPAPAPDGGVAGRGGSGGSGTGGVGGMAGMGGSGGSAGADGRASDTADARPRDGAAPDVGRDSPADRAGDRPGADGGSSGPSLDECFAGFSLSGQTWQIATKATNDGRIRMRIALRRDSIGTSGTIGWVAHRFGLETDDDRICVVDPAQLTPAYKLSRHNCSDVFDITVGQRRYEIQTPDTDNRPTVPPRTVARLSVYIGSNLVLGPVMLSTVSCTSGTEFCNSGGPCN